MSKHTEPKWFAEYSSNSKMWQVWHQGGAACIADVHKGVLDDPSGQANAHLIAASPEMRNLLQDLVSALSQEWLPDGDMDDLRDRARELLNKIDKDTAP
jgi:hypothetical protein